MGHIKEVFESYGDNLERTRLKKSLMKFMSYKGLIKGLPKNLDSEMYIGLTQSLVETMLFDPDEKERLWAMINIRDAYNGFFSRCHVKDKAIFLETRQDGESVFFYVCDAPDIYLKRKVNFDGLPTMVEIS